MQLPFKKKNPAATRCRALLWLPNEGKKAKGEEKPEEELRGKEAFSAVGNNTVKEVVLLYTLSP